jgi:hypothetical protein
VCWRVRACVRACVGVCARVCVCARVRAWHMLACKKQRADSTGNESTLDQTHDSCQSIALSGRLRAEMPTVAEERLTPVESLVAFARHSATDGEIDMLHSIL